MKQNILKEGIIFGIFAFILNIILDLIILSNFPTNTFTLIVKLVLWIIGGILFKILEPYIIKKKNNQE